MTGQTQTLEVHLGVDYRDLFMGVLMGMLMMGIVTVGVVFGLLKRLRYYEQLEAYDAGEDDEFDRWEAEAEGEAGEKTCQEKMSPTDVVRPTPGGDETKAVAPPAERKSSIKRLKTFVSKVTQLNPAFTTEKADTLDYSKTETGLSEKADSPMIKRSKTTPSPASIDMSPDMNDWVRERETSRSLTMPKVDRKASLEILYKEN